MSGFINEEHYLEFAHPYLKRICDAFPKDWVKLYHNDAEVDACLDHLPDAGFNVLNWGKQKHITEVKRRVGDRICLMGNVNPLEIAVRGTPDEVKDETLEVLEGSGGEGIILSVGGGVAPECRAKIFWPCLRPWRNSMESVPEAWLRAAAKRRIDA